VIVRKRELRDAIGLHKTVLARALNDEGVQDALDEMGVQVQHFFFVRPGVSFDPLPDGGFLWGELAQE
jgi:hypothetical protein